MLYSEIVGCSGYLPKNVISNYELENSLDTTNKWIIERTGIKQRHIATDNVLASDLAILATKKLLNQHPNSSIDVIIATTTTPDRHFPSVACKVQQAFFAKTHIPAFDVQAVCSGFLYGLEVSDNFIKSGKYKTILLVSTEKMSTILNWEQRNTAILFGDGAGAVLIKRSESNSESRIIDIITHANGTHYNVLQTTTFQNILLGEKCSIEMKGQDLFKHAVHHMSNTIKTLLIRNNLEASKVKFIVPHQANKRILDSIEKNLNVDKNKIVVTVDKHANCSSASIPLALNHLLENNQLQKGDLIILVAFGAGLTWGATLIKW